MANAMALVVEHRPAESVHGEHPGGGPGFREFSRSGCRCGGDGGLSAVGVVGRE
jgi:hypothetical protein